MKLNPDCIRDVLLYLEEHLKINHEESSFESITLYQLTQSMTENYDYTKEDVWYSVYNLKEIHYIDGLFQSADNEEMYICNISNITWNGHQFLNTIRPDTVWQATKKGASKLGLMSIHALSGIAMKVAEAIILDPTVITKIVSMV